MRQYASRATLFSAYIFGLIALWLGGSLILGLTLFLMALVFFSIAVVPALSFTSNPRFLIGYVGQFCISGSLFIISTAHLFSVWGVKQIPASAMGGADALYFSIATFTTLGYGDLAPIGLSRLFAGLIALIGNLHMGLIAGATFAALTSKKV